MRSVGKAQAPLYLGVAQRMPSLAGARAEGAAAEAVQQAAAAEPV